MNLDKRIGTLTCFDIEKAKQFLGKKGYFANAIANYNYLDIRKYGTLTDVRDNDYPFREWNHEYWSLFIPENLLKKEVVSRPFSIIEFKGHTPKMLFPDDLIHFRNKDTGFEEYAQRYNGYIVNSENTYVCLGSREYSLKDLFEKFEYLDQDGEWNMFGVKE